MCGPPLVMCSMGANLCRRGDTQAIERMTFAGDVAFLSLTRSACVSVGLIAVDRAFSTLTHLEMATDIWEGLANERPIRRSWKD